MNSRICVLWISTLVTFALLLLPAALAAPAAAAPMASVTRLSSAPNPAVEGVPITFTAGISFTASQPATGTITLTDTYQGVASVLGTITLDPTTGAGTFMASTLGVGLHNVVASYSGDSHYTSSSSQALQQTILSSFTPTTTTLVSPVNPSTVGESVTLSAAVVVSSLSTMRPTGTVTFYDGANVLGGASVVNGGGTKTLNSASLATSSLTAGSHNIQAVYSGDNVFAGSTSAIVVQVIQVTTAYPTTTALNSSAAFANAGQAITYTAQVTSTSGTPTGAVTITDGASVLAQVTLDGSGQATLTTSSLAVGTHAITAAYGGDANFGASTSATLMVNVQGATLAATTTMLASSANPSTVGDLIALIATVTSASGMPTGTVAFQDGSSLLATVNLQNGVATLNTLSLTAATHSLSANYSGDSNYAASSGTLSQVVNPPHNVPTTTNLRSSANPASYGQEITITATVSGMGGTPTGTVTFTVGSSIAAVNLDNSGTAVFTTSALRAGTASVSAVYSGDAKFAGSASPLVPENVYPALLTIMASSGSMTYGGTVTAITASYSGVVAGDTAASLTTAPTCSTSATSTSAVGTYPSTCSGAVDSNYTITYLAGTVTVGPQPPTPPPARSLSIWPDSTTPAIPSAVTGTPMELGVKFRSDISGVVAGIRFYKGALNTGIHTGSLWTSTGTLLATGTFTNETSSGWQTLLFNSPVAISANTTYVASYHSDSGVFAINFGYFQAHGADNAPLHALQSGVDGINGVLLNSPGGQFPTSGLGDNYWVDVLFKGTGSGVPPAPQSISAVAGSPQSATVGATFAVPLQVKVLDGSSGPLSGITVTFNAPTSGASSTFAGNVSSATAVTNAQGVAFAPALTANNTAGDYTVTASTGSLAPAIFALSNTAAGTPPPTSNTSIWPDSTTPAIPSAVTGTPMELGVKFRSDISGVVAGIRFYKSVLNSGTHTGSLWTSTGTLLASGTFTNETSNGWQTLLFSSPVAISANTTYVASYHSAGGVFAINFGYFQAHGADNAPLHALQSGVDGINGVLLNSPGGQFPTSGLGDNYWVDVLFQH